MHRSPQLHLGASTAIMPAYPQILITCHQHLGIAARCSLCGSRPAGPCVHAGPHSKFNLKLHYSHRSKAIGCDNLPPWFIKLIGLFIAEPLVRLYALSLFYSPVSLQWKCTVITPVPNQHPPAGVSDYRLISILPMLSTIFQKILVRRYIYPMLTVSPLADKHV